MTFYMYHRLTGRIFIFLTLVAYNILLHTTNNTDNEYYSFNHISRIFVTLYLNTH